MAKFDTLLARRIAKADARAVFDMMRGAEWPPTSLERVLGDLIRLDTADTLEALANL